MKLMFCFECQDVVKLSTYKVRECECGKIKAKYEINGDGFFHAKDDRYLLLGFANDSFQGAVQKAYDTIESMGVEFTAFVIPEPCDTFTRLDEKDFKYFSETS